MSPYLSNHFISGVVRTKKRLQLTAFLDPFLVNQSCWLRCDCWSAGNAPKVFVFQLSSRTTTVSIFIKCSIVCVHFSQRNQPTRAKIIRSRWNQGNLVWCKRFCHANTLISQMRRPPRWFPPLPVRSTRIRQVISICLCLLIQLTRVSQAQLPVSTVVKATVVLKCFNFISGEWHSSLQWARSSMEMVLFAGRYVLAGGNQANNLTCQRIYNIWLAPIMWCLLAYLKYFCTWHPPTGSGCSGAWRPSTPGNWPRR